MKQVYLGKFNQETSKMVISDPCYEFDYEAETALNVNYFIPNAKKGKWKCWVLTDTNVKRNALIAIHDTVNNDSIMHFDEWPLNPVDSTIDVDSGQAAIYDAKYFADDNQASGNNTWYDINSMATDTKKQASIIPNGVVSSSGYGDGAYDLYVKKSDNNKVVAVKIVFITEDDESD